MADMMYVPMTDEARRALITISVLWVLFAVVVFFRWVGRIRGAGIGADDVLSLVALVSFEDTEFQRTKANRCRFSLPRRLA
jgi:hypothetical protein